MSKILIMDDEREFVDMLALRLTKTGGYDVIKAFDGEEGLKSVQDNNPDLILLDIMMPKLDGYEVINRLKADEATKNIPVIILSASTSPSTLKKFRKIGVIDFIIKPFEAPDLMEKIKKCLTKS